MKVNLPALRHRLRGSSQMQKLAALAVVALICVVSAGLALLQEERGQSSQFTAAPVFPGLEDRLMDVDKIVVTVGRGLRGPEEIVLARRAGGGFGVVARDNYPANPVLIDKFLKGMSSLIAVERRTENPAWYAALGLVEPEKMGSALRISFIGKDGKPIASLLAGKVPEQIVDVAGQGMIYVRRDGEGQTYLARGSFPLAQNTADYLDRKFLDLKPEEIARVTLWAGSDHAVTMLRKKGEPDFVLQDIPHGRSTRGAPVVNGTATAIAAASFDDVVPGATLEFPAASPRAEFLTYDGMLVTVTLAANAGFLWAKIAADSESPGHARADDINRRLGGWAFRLPSELGNELVQTMDLLTREGEALPVK